MRWCWKKNQKKERHVFHMRRRCSSWSRATRAVTVAYRFTGTGERTPSSLSRSATSSSSSAVASANQPPSVHISGVNVRAEASQRKEEGDSCVAADTEIRPGNTSLKPYERPVGPKWSFMSVPSDRTLINPDYHSNSIVPNNDAKPKLPMWSSSLTSPKLTKVKLSPDNWINPYASAGYVDDSRVSAFISWVTSRADAAHRAANACTEQAEKRNSGSSYLSYALQHHVQLKLRGGGSVRGLYARRSFEEGDVILSVPSVVGTATADTAAASPLWGLHLNSDTLRSFSSAAQRSGVPSFQQVRDTVSVRRSSFDPTPHALFVDQLYCSLLLACEKAAGVESPLHPYLALFPDPLFDDHTLKEINRSAMDPYSHLEYTDHVSRMKFFLLQVQSIWPSGEEKVPAPSIEDLTWALRLILSRQIMLPSFRTHDDVAEIMEKESTPDRLVEEQPDFWMRNITKIRKFVFDKIFCVLDEDRIKDNIFDPYTIPTLCPLFDMLMHDPRGGNTRWEIEGAEPHSATGNTGGSATAKRRSAGGDRGELLLIATKRVAEGQELTRCFSRCYSTSYTLYRYGFLAVRDRELDQRAALVASGVAPSLLCDMPEAPGIPASGLHVDANKTKRLTTAATALYRRLPREEVSAPSIPV